MSINFTRQLWCDIVDGGACEQWLDTDTHITGAQMRAIGRRRGWKRITIEGKARDACPTHAKALGL